MATGCGVAGKRVVDFPVPVPVPVPGQIKGGHRAAQGGNGEADGEHQPLEVDAAGAGQINTYRQ